MKKILVVYLNPTTRLTIGGWLLSAGMKDHVVRVLVNDDFSAVANEMVAAAKKSKKRGLLAIVEDYPSCGVNASDVVNQIVGKDHSNEWAFAVITAHPTEERLARLQSELAKINAETKIYPLPLDGKAIDFRDFIAAFAD